MTDADPELILHARQIHKRFGGIVAVEPLDLGIAQGGIHGLIGPNGSGKTTVLNLLSGHCLLDGGRVSLLGEDITGLKPHQIARYGIARTFQNLRTFTRLTVLDNIRSAWVATAGVGRSEIAERSDTILERIGLSSSRSRIAGDLSLGDQRRLELGRAMARRPALLLLDEPAGGMSPRETESMGDLLRGIVQDGSTILLVEHKMSLVMQLCRRITVLNFGRKIASGPPEAVSADLAVVEAYLGSARVHA